MIEKANPKLDVEAFVAWLEKCSTEAFAIGHDAWDSDAVACWLRSMGLERPRVGVGQVACWDVDARDWRHAYFGPEFWVAQFVRETMEIFNNQGVRAMSKADTVALVEKIRSKHSEQV